MDCPIDGSPLTMSERSGIEIDYCPKCRGVWLDRGELDKIIDRSMQHEAAAHPAAPSTPAPGSYEQQRDQRGQYYDQRYQPYRKKRKEHWLAELFD